MDQASVQREEWELIYGELRTALSAFGREDAFGDGDYWIVDDNYGSPQHKICVGNPSFISRPMVKAVQRVLQGRKLRWEVLVSLDDSSTTHPDDLGVTVTAHQVTEHWNPERMKRTYGSAFVWDLRAIDS